MRIIRPSGIVRRKWLLILAAAVLIVAFGAYGAHSWYNRNLAPVSSSAQIIYFPIASGSSLHEIATDLKHEGLIRSAPAFETYVKSRRLYPKMQAGTYALSPSMSATEIVNKIINGDVTRSYVTILPGKTIKQIRQTFLQAGYSGGELDTALKPATYNDMPMLASLPPGASLEGFLYPDTFQKVTDTPAKTIVRESLEEMQDHLTPDIINGFTAQGLSTYQGVALASIVYQESGDPADQPTVAQVFLSRLKQGTMLGSDVTSLYGAVNDGLKLPDNDAQAAAVAIAHDSPYNTRLHTGLPPSPIGNMTSSALQAVAHPSSTDYLFFVAGDDGTLHFSRTAAEHEEAVSKYCHKLCGQ